MAAPPGPCALDEFSLIYALVAPGAPAAAPASSSAVPEALVAKCKAAGEAVASLKKGGGSKEDVAKAVDALLKLKQTITKMDPDHPLAIVDKKKKKADAAAPKRRENHQHCAEDA